jgi:WD40 repeat protein
MRIRQKSCSILIALTMLMALFTACTGSVRKPEVDLWGVWSFTNSEGGNLVYAYDLHFQEDGSLILQGVPQDQITYMVIAPGRMKFTMGGSSEVLNYNLEEDTLTLYFEDGHNTYTRAPETRPITQGEPMAVSTPTQNNIVGEIVDNIFSSGAVITPENAAEVTELRHLENVNITGLVWTPDGAEIVMAIRNGIYFCDPDSLEKRLFIETESRITSIAFSPDGRVLASGNSDGMLQLWDVETGVSIHTWEGHTNSVINLVFSPDNVILASTGRDDYDSLKLWEPNTGRLIISREVRLHDVTLHPSRALTFSPNGSILATGSGEEYAILFWDPVNSTLIRKIKGFSGMVRDITFSPDGSLLASAGRDASVRLWDVETGTSLNILQTDAGDLNSVSFSPDGRVLASGSGDGTIRLYDVKTAKLLLAREGHIGEIWVGSATIENPCSDDPPPPPPPIEARPYLIVSPTCGEPTTQETADDGTVEIIPGTDLRVEGYNFLPDILVEFWWVDPANSRFRQRQEGQNVTVIPDENGEFIVDIIWPYRIIPPSYQEGVSEWELQGQQFTSDITGVGKKVTFVPDVSFSPVGRMLATWGGDGTMRLWGIP